MSDWFKQIGQSRDKLRVVQNSLMDLGDSFLVTGNVQMHDLLYRYAEVIGLCSDNIDNAAGKAVNELYQNAQQSTANMVQAALHVVSMPKEDEDA